LELQNNQIRNLSGFLFANLTGLRNLSISSNPINLIDAAAFAGLKQLYQLDFYGNQAYFSWPQGLLNGLTSLQALDLHSSNINNPQKDMFKTLTALQTLQLSYNYLNNLNGNLSFVDLSGLRSLALRGCGFYFGPQAFAFSGLTSLRTLDLSENSLHHIIANTFSGLSLLETLYLNSVWLFYFETGAFNGLSSLTRLEFRNCYISSFPTGVLLGAPLLQTIDASYNQFGSFNDNSSLVGLAVVTGLRNLTLTGNQIVNIASGASAR